MNVKSWGHAILHLFQVLNKWLQLMQGGSQGTGKSSMPNICTAASRNSLLCSYHNKGWWRLQAHQPLGVADLFLQNCPLSRSFTASLLARTGFHLDVQHNKEDPEIQITGGWPAFWKDITSFLRSSPTPSATDHSGFYLPIFPLVYRIIYGTVLPARLSL